MSTSSESSTYYYEGWGNMAEKIRNEMIQCTWAQIQTYLPPAPSQDHMESAFKELSPQLLQNNHGVWQWTNLPPDSALENDSDYFDFLGHVCEGLEKTSSSRPGQEKPPFRLVQRPDHCAAASFAGELHKMAGYFYLQEEDGRKTKPDLMRHIGVAAEYKKSKHPTVVYQNHLQIFADATVAMYEEPQRRFMFGLTIEGEDLRVWYFSRSHSVMSDVHNWKQSPKEFIAILLTFMFATPVELGFDPTIRRITPPSGPEFYVYEIEDTKSHQKHIYRTVRSLSDHRSLRISGRSTRVWLVEEVKSQTNLDPLEKGKYVVLKDVWLDQDAKTEREILEELLRDFHAGVERGLDHNAAFKTLPASFQNVVRSRAQNPEQHFLSVRCDAVRNSCWEHHPEGRTIFKAPSTVLAAQRTFIDPYGMEPALTIEPTTASQATPPNHTPKKQYRIVFNEVCEAVQKVKNFDDAMKAMQDAVICLAIMFLAGWVHRDISGGNILLFEGRGLLGDLEYAKPFSATAANDDPQAGTAFFMAFEIMTQIRLFNPPFEPDLYEKYGQLKYGQLTVRHHYLHDLESLWWLHLWTLLQRVHHTPSNEYAALVFRNSLTPSPKRWQAFTSQSGLVYSLLAGLHPTLRPLVEVVVRTQSFLFEKYEKIWDTSDISHYGEAFEQLYNLFSQSIGYDVKLTTFPYAAESTANHQSTSAATPILPVSAHLDTSLQPSQTSAPSAPSAISLDKATKTPPSSTSGSTSPDTLQQPSDALRMPKTSDLHAVDSGPGELDANLGDEDQGGQQETIVESIMKTVRGLLPDSFTDLRPMKRRRLFF